MSIAQNLKILNRPIKELAMLPQEVIMQMAQNDQLPVAYVAPILKVKAEMDEAEAKAAAMMEQQQQDQMAVGTGTVLEKIIAQNAANEAKTAMPMMSAMPPMAQQMPMALPEDSGIAALPVDEGVVPEFAGGGIVAFKSGNLVEDIDLNALTRGIDEASETTPPYRGAYSGLSEDAAAIKAAREQFLGANQSVADLLAYNEAAEKRAEARARQQTGARLLQAGLLGLGGDSPYAFQNLGKMAPAVEGYMGDVEKQEAAKEARSRAAIAAKGAARAEDEKAFNQALENRAKLEAAVVAAGKGTDMSRYVDNYIKSQRAMGNTASEDILRLEGNNEYLSRFAAAGARAGAAVSQADTAAEKAAADAHQRALKFSEEATSFGGSEYQEYLRRKAADAKANKESGAKPGDPNYQDSAGDLRKELYERGRKIPAKPEGGKPAAPKPEAGAKPDAAKPAAPPAPPSINVGNDMTTERLTGKELRQKIEALADHPNRDKLAKRLREAEAEYKRRIFAEKNPTKVTSQAEFDNLPEGTVYQLPNGVKGIKGGVAQSSTSTPTPPAGAKPAAALPPGIPPGSKQIGTSGGKPVYELPNGKRVIQQ